MGRSGEGDGEGASWDGEREGILVCEPHAGSAAAISVAVAVVVAVAGVVAVGVTVVVAVAVVVAIAVVVAVAVAVAVAAAVAASPGWRTSVLVGGPSRVVGGRDSGSGGDSSASLVLLPSPVPSSTFTSSTLTSH